MMLGLPALAGAQTLPPRAEAVRTVAVPLTPQPPAPEPRCDLRITGPEGLRVIPSKPTASAEGSRCIWLIQAPGGTPVSMVFGATPGQVSGYDVVRLFAADGEMLGTLREVASGTSLQGLPRTLVMEIETRDPQLLRGMDVHIGASILEF